MREIKVWYPEDFEFDLYIHIRINRDPPVMVFSELW